MASGNVIFEIKINAKKEQVAKELGRDIGVDLAQLDIHSYKVTNDGFFVIAAFTDDTYRGKLSKDNYSIFLDVVGKCCHSHGIC